MANPRRYRFTCLYCAHGQSRHSPKGIYVRCRQCGKAQPGAVMARDLLELAGAPLRPPPSPAPPA